MKVLDYLRIIFRYSSLPVFTITVKNGQAFLSQGKIPEKFITEFSSIAQNQNIPKGVIYGVRDNQRIILDFSSSISDADRQRFRNVLNLYHI
ncbi:MAG: DUF3634 family protein [Sedimentisphaerales bacterium]|jgi:hypothetical protein